MFKTIDISSLYVLDQDEALDFYVGKLGLEVRSDFDLGFMRWLTVGVPGHADHQVLLEVPGVPSVSEETAEQVRDLLTKGALGLGFILTTDDCRKTFDDLSAKSVEITQEPTEQPHGIDCAIRDPFGNHIRITQPSDMRDITDEDRKRWAAGDTDS
jgi:catechol 2,3-dioxygenase-like lactoylglutathione lyase family enzyme